MKIIQVIGSLGDGGAEKVVLTLDRLFKKNNIDSKIIVLKEKNFYDTKDCTIINLNKKKSQAKKSLIKLLKQENPNLILAHMQDMSRLLKDLKWDNIYNIIHTDIYSRLQKENLWKRFKKLKDFKKVYSNKQIITVSNGIKKNFLKLNIPTKSIQTIYNPFPIKEIQKLANKHKIKENNYIIFVGSLREVKNPQLLLNTFSLLNDKTLKLIIVGDGPLKKELTTLAKSLNILSRVNFLGWATNPYPYIKNAKVLVLSSSIEGFSNVLVEALILHTPVVSTNCPSGPNEILQNELSQFLVELDNKTALAKKIESAIKSYPNITPKYYHKFDENNILKEYISLTKKKNEYK